MDVRHGHDLLHRPDSHVEANAFGVKAWRAGAEGIATRSVRHDGGQCLAVFQRKCILSCARTGLLAMAWDGTTLTVES